MISNDPQDDAKPRHKELHLQPLSSVTPQAQAPVTSAQDDLASLRAHIDEINSNPADESLPQPAPVIIPQQQNVAYSDLPQPIAPEAKHKSAAVKIVRDKLAKLYAKEPEVVEEAIDAFAAAGHRSKHQQYMYDLSTSNKSLAHIQTEWHLYYTALPDNEKHEVWQEFYAANEQSKPVHLAHHVPKATHHQQPAAYSSGIKGARTTAEIKNQILHKVSAGGKLKAKHHFQSLLFGLGMASIVVIIFLFGFFNERFIAPFMSPSKQVSATPIVGNDTNVGPESKIIIPKINLEVPVIYGLPDTSEKSVQNGLESGVVHYSTSPIPGQTGNTVVVGHSSNNILNKGKYKFAFVLLKKLEVGDTFSLQKDGVRYTYQIFEKKIVKPTDVSVLGASTKPNTATLITCDPPGTSVNRLIIVAEQISPDPSGNKIVEQKAPALTDTGVLPSNAPSLWQRIKNIF